MAISQFEFRGIHYDIEFPTTNVPNQVLKNKTDFFTLKHFQNSIVVILKYFKGINAIKVNPTGKPMSVITTNDQFLYYVLKENILLLNTKFAFNILEKVCGILG